MSDKVKVFITKYALKFGGLSGILEVEALPTVYGGVRFLNPINKRWDYAGKGNWFKDRGKAVEKAEKMRAKRKGAIQLELTALEQLKFD